MKNHKEQLVALLNALECEHIDELLEESPDFFTTIGKTIAGAAVVGSAIRDESKPADSKTEELEKRISNNEIAIQAFWALIKYLQPPETQTAVDELMSKHFNANRTLNGFKTATFVGE